MKEKLKPCPFCGSHKIHMIGYPDGGYLINCLLCPVEMCSPNANMTKEYIVAAWNRRAEVGDE
jgi:Lar family restriction alleviation protein